MGYVLIVTDKEVDMVDNITILKFNNLKENEGVENFTVDMISD